MPNENRTHNRRNDNNHREPRAQPEPMASERLDIDENGIRKTYFIDLAENERGRVIKLKERRDGGCSIIMIPADSARELAEFLIRLADFHEQTA